MSGVRRWVVLVGLAGSAFAACSSDADPVDDSTVTVFGPYVGADADHFAEGTGHQQCKSVYWRCQ